MIELKIKDYYVSMIDLSAVKCNAILIYNDCDFAVNLNLSELSDIDTSDLVKDTAELIYNGLADTDCYYVEISGVRSDMTIIDVTCYHISDLTAICAMLRNADLDYFVQCVTNRYEFLDM